MMRRVDLAAVDAVSTIGRGSSIQGLETYRFSQRCVETERVIEVVDGRT